MPEQDHDQLPPLISHSDARALGADDGEGADAAHLARVMRYLDDALDAAGVAALEREMATDPEKREAFARICFADALAWEALAESSAGFAGCAIEGTGPDVALQDGAWEPGLSDAMVLPALRPEPEPEEPAGSSPPAWSWPDPQGTGRAWTRRAGLAAAAALLLGGGGLFLALRQPATATASTPPAILDSVAGARWDHRTDLAAGAPLKTGEDLTLTAGYAALHFQDGADVVLEAPAHLRIGSASDLTLVSGTAVVRMPAGRSGFVVHTASGTFTDLGTEFAVSLKLSTAAAEVQVFQGHVQVAPAPTAGAATPSIVAAGDAARLSGGTVSVTPGGAQAQAFVRSLATVPSLDLADLLCGGDGTTRRRGNQIDANRGVAGPLGAIRDTLGDGRYHPVAELPVLDGSFVPNGADGPVTVDSAGHAFRFPRTSGATYLHIVSGGQIPVPKGADRIGTVLAGTDLAGPDHALLFIHPNAGLTLDLAAIRHLHPGSRPTRLRALLGNSHPSEKQTKADAFVLVDGASRFERRRFTGSDGAVTIDVPIRDSDRFLTLATTDGGDGIFSDDVLFGDPTLELAPASDVATPR